MLYDQPNRSSNGCDWAQGGTLSAWKNITGHVYLLRHRLLQFVQNILYYMTFEVLLLPAHSLLHHLLYTFLPIRSLSLGGMN